MPLLRSSVPLRAAGAALLLALAGCASYSPGGLPAGATAAQVVERMGEPTGRYTLPGGGTRLEYARGPMGKHTYMVDLDAEGRLQRWDQVLTEREFAAVVPGMPSDEVLRRLGRPGSHLLIPRQGFDIWNYRYDASPLCQWFQVSIRDGRVAEAGFGLDPLCDAGDRDSRD